MTRVSFFWLAGLLSLHAVDLNNDGLSDVWQARYGAQNLSANEDSDGDGYTNAAESLAGTDPLDGSHHPAQGGNSLKGRAVSIQTEAGKWYQLCQSPDLGVFTPAGPLLVGTGGVMDLIIDQQVPVKRGGYVQHDRWTEMGGKSLVDLANDADFPNTPDGRSEAAGLEIEPVMATGFAGRLRALVAAPTDGRYEFYLSAGSAAELYLSETGEDEDLVPVAAVSGGLNLSPNDWEVEPGQKSEQFRLTVGQTVLLEVRYLATRSQSHCQVGWTTPGVLEPTVIPRSAIQPVDWLFGGDKVPVFLEHDYDRSGVTDLLFGDGSSRVTGISGMSGSAEQLDADPSGENDRFSIGGRAEKHLYATWKFHMTFGHDEVSLMFFNTESSSQLGPRIYHRETGPDDDPELNRATIRVIPEEGGSRVIDVTYGDVYRVELVASLDSEPFHYRAGLMTRTVAEDRFDLYISDAAGNLVSSVLGLPFVSRGENAVTGIDLLRAHFVSRPKIIFDDWEFTAGEIPGNGYLRSLRAGFEPGEERHFFKFLISDGDQDGDGLTDWEEEALAPHQPFLFFDANSSGGGVGDMASAVELLNSVEDQVTVTLQASDTSAFERESNGASSDHGEITLTRTGPLAPLTVQLCVEPLANTGNTATICDGTCCTLIGSAGDEAAEVDDYEIVDNRGHLVTNSVTFEFGEMTKKLTVRARPDAIAEYPETLNLALEADDTGSYDIAENQNGASIQLFDLPDSVENQIIFTGGFTPEPGVSSTASGTVTAILNGTRTHLTLYDSFSGLTSAQQDSHIHKSGVNGSGLTPGAIIYEITNTPEDGASGPLNGPLDAYPWDLRNSAGAIPTAGGAASKQVIIDSLFGQNGESPLYLNLHTENFPGGEVWAFLNLSGGSQNEPGPPEPGAGPGSVDFPRLAGQELRVEVRRFLNQATFGATDEAVDQLVSTIESRRQSDPAYHRIEAFEEWIDSQIQLPQSWHLDYVMASYFQHLKLGGMYDPARNPSSNDYTTPTQPTSWPNIRRPESNPAHWHLSQPYPATEDDYRLASDNGLDVRPASDSVYTGHWQMMINAKDQLRQKMGFALQQIVVVSYESNTLDSQAFGMANYQDQLNFHAFSYYRDILGFVNWSPIMGSWLSSLQNQKAADLDGDGQFDVFPDENLARENMQLFSIGLFEMWPDGTLRLNENGLPIPTYDNEDIRQFAKVLTGQSFSWYNDYDEPWGGTPYAQMVKNDRFDVRRSRDAPLGAAYNYPMKMFGEFHDTTVKEFAGTIIDNTQIEDPTEQGIADIEEAIDWLAGKPGDGQPDFDMIHSHRSTPAFISLRLIQRFVTSNPSRDYLHRVSTTFKESEGNLGLTIRAILLDPEARVPDPLTQDFGMKKSPLEGYLQLLRSLDSFTYLPLRDPGSSAPFNDAEGDYSNPDLYLGNFGWPNSQSNNQERNFRFLQRRTDSFSSDALQMNPLDQETVFNWYLPDYNPGGRAGEAGLVAPELQLANEQDIVRNINYIEDLVRDDVGITAFLLADQVENHRRVFGVGPDDRGADPNNRIRLDFDRLAERFYPDTPPTPVNGRSSESLADEALVDSLDEILTFGWFKRLHPFDQSDDDDPSLPDGNRERQNRREAIIDAIGAYGDPWNGSGDESDRRGKVKDALYLLTLTAEYQIKK